MVLNQEELNKFNVQKKHLCKMLTEASGVIQELSMTNAGENLKKLGEKVNNDTFKIQVIGTFKNGKSTFINSLLGEDVLPAYALPATAIINEIKYGDTKKAIVHFRNPLPKKLPTNICTKALKHIEQYGTENIPPLTIEYHEIKDYVCIPIGEDPIQMLLESPYEKVELFWPLDILKEGIEIIDSPGLDEEAIRTRVTKDYLTKADAIVFMLIADKLCGQKEMEFIEDNLHALGFTEPFFIVNRFDLIEEEEREGIRNYAKLKLSKYTTNDIYYVSALQALKAEINKDSKLYEQSGMGLFTAKLTQFLTKDKGRIKLSQPARELKRILNNEALYKVIPGQKAMLECSLDEIKARYEKVKPQLDTQILKKEQIIHKLTLKIEQSKPELQRAIRQHTLSIIDMIPGWINEYTPKNTIGLIPKKAKIQAVVKEISDYVNKQIIAKQKVWKEEVMIPLAQEKANNIFESSEQDLTKLYSTIDEITIQITGNDNIKTKDVSIWERICVFGGGLLMGLPDIAIAGGVNGLTKELIKNIGVILATECVLGLFLGFTNPFVLVGGIVTAILGGGFTTDAAMNKIKQDLTKVFVDQISSNTEKGTIQASQSITSQLSDIVNVISSAIDKEIGQTEEQINLIVKAMTEGQANIDARKEILSSCEAKIKDLSIELDNLTFELIEQK